MVELIGAAAGVISAIVAVQQGASAVRRSLAERRRRAEVGEPASLLPLFTPADMEAEIRRLEAVREADGKPPLGGPAPAGPGVRDFVLVRGCAPAVAATIFTALCLLVLRRRSTRRRVG